MVKGTTIGQGKKNPKTNQTKPNRTDKKNKLVKRIDIF